MSKKFRFDTKLIHSEEYYPEPEKPLNFPIYQTSTFDLDNFSNLENLFSLNKRGFVYTRGGNPTVNLLERRLSKLENGIDGVCFSSGMGAISSVLFSLLKSGDRIIAHNTLYGSSHSFIEHFLTRYNIKVDFIDLTNIDNLKSIIDYDVKVIYFETPSNPTLEIIDIEEISNIAHLYNSKVVVDNTFLTPYFQNPLEHGADIVVHSLTKYINGHGDALGGIAISKDQDYIDFLKFGVMCEIGTNLDPNSAFLILRGLKTLSIRMEKHQKSALKIANFLVNNKRIKNVFYPGLNNFSYKNIVKKQMKGYGGIISFELDSDLLRTRKFIESLKIIKLAVSLGDCETLVEHPLSMTHRTYLDKKESDVYKKLENLVRISVGLESVEDLIDDIDQAIKKVFN